MSPPGSALITGATGFIGSALSRRLAEEGREVYCLVRGDGGEERPIQDLPGVEFIKVKSFQTTQLRKALKSVSADIVFNLASYGVNQKDCDAEAMIDGNVNLLARLLIATADFTIKHFFHTGSCSEYGTPIENKPFTEQHSLRPISLYGAAKAAAELYGNALAARLKMPFVTLRLFGIYGPGEAPHRLIPNIINRLMRDEPVDLTPGEQVKDFLYIDDLVEALSRVGDCRYLKPLEAFNICSGRPVRVRDVGEIVARAMNKPAELLQWGKRAYRPDEPMWLVGDNRRFREATGWSPRVSLSEGIIRMVNTVKKDDILPRL